MKKDFSEIVFILDRSGSMSGLEEDTIGGFNATLAQQKKEPGDAVVSVVLFDDVSEVICDRVPIARMEPLTGKQYYVRGCTALIDAIGGAVQHIGNIHKYAREEDVPARTLFVITTDGYENASTRFTAAQVREMVKSRQENDGWEFLFLGANIDAVETARSFGIREDHAVDYCCDEAGTEMLYRGVNAAMSCLREGPSLSAGWRAELDADFSARGRKPRR